MQEDIEPAFEINSIAFVFARFEEPSYVTDFTLSMANVENDQLTETFAENYAQGTLVEVYHSDSLHLENGYGNELVLELDTPFFYNGQDNLLIDFITLTVIATLVFTTGKQVLRDVSGACSVLVAAEVQRDIYSNGFHTLSLKVPRILIGTHSVLLK